jgi:hypothetical protein
VAQENERQKKRCLLNSAESAEEQITLATASQVARDSHHRTATEQAFALVLVSLIGSEGRPLGMFGI